MSELQLKLQKHIDICCSALTFRDFVPRLELLTLFRDLEIF